MKTIEETRESYRKSQKEKVKRRRDWLLSIKTTAGCKVCVEKHPACLTFHHKNPATKKFGLNIGIEKYAMIRIIDEIAKCDILCFNCHNKLHYQERLDIKNSKNIL